MKLKHSHKKTEKLFFLSLMIMVKMSNPSSDATVALPGVL